MVELTVKTEAWMPYAVDLRIQPELNGVGDTDIPNVFHFVFGLDRKQGGAASAWLVLVAI